MSRLVLRFRQPNGRALILPVTTRILAIREMEAGCVITTSLDTIGMPAGNIQYEVGESPGEVEAILQQRDDQLREALQKAAKKRKEAAVAKLAARRDQLAQAHTEAFQVAPGDTIDEIDEEELLAMFDGGGVRFMGGRGGGL